jgi:hypothetical protein
MRLVSGRLNLLNCGELGLAILIHIIKTLGRRTAVKNNETCLRLFIPQSSIDILSSGIELVL